MAMAFSLQQGPWQKDKKLKKQENQEKARKRRRQKEKTKRNIIYKKNKNLKPEKKITFFNTYHLGSSIVCQIYGSSLEKDLMHWTSPKGGGGRQTDRQKYIANLRLNP